MRYLIVSALILLATPAHAEKVGIPWKGDYAHNSDDHYSPQNKYKSGLSKFFNNGAPEESGKIQREGVLEAELIKPNDAAGMVPYVILMHGCSGLTPPVARWAREKARIFLDQGYGVLIPDSFKTRNVREVCGSPNYHWGWRRAEDAYSALDYLIAFDLNAFDLGFAMGTAHPRVDWSARINDSVRKDSLPGPDGIGGIAPLVTTGMISPALTNATVAAFTGGFKRSHGAFRYGDLATRNYGSHYGFIEQGVVYSKLQPGLATIYVLDDGTIDMRTWTAADDALLPRVRFARQNGVPLAETDPASHASVPGPLVAKWGPGNWSGSAEKNLRTIRAAICLQETATKRFLIYGYFSTATPSALARVYQAYSCRYAMLLDMNALEHTYLALYVHKAGGGLVVQHLVEGMAALDKESGNQLVTRFLGYPDNRDFFYLTRREAAR